MSTRSQEMYRDHMTECLIATGMPPALAASVALREYPQTDTGNRARQGEEAQ